MKYVLFVTSCLLSLVTCNSGKQKISLNDGLIIENAIIIPSPNNQQKVIVINDLAVNFLMNNDYSDVLGMLEYLIRNSKKYNLSFIFSVFETKKDLPFSAFSSYFNKKYIFKNEDYYEIGNLEISVSEFNEIKSLKKDEYYLKLS